MRHDARAHLRPIGSAAVIDAAAAATELARGCSERTSAVLVELLAAASGSSNHCAGLKLLRLGRYLRHPGDLDTGVVSTTARVHQLWIRAASDNSAEIQFGEHPEGFVTNCKLVCCSLHHVDDTALVPINGAISLT